MQGQLARITSTFFVSLINRLGIRPPPGEGFMISNVVQPVSIVDSDINIPAITSSPLLDVPFTAGPQTTPPAGTILADTGAQLAGSWFARLIVSGDYAGTFSFNVEFARRNAANNADVWKQALIIAVAANPIIFIEGRYNLLSNERLVVRIGTQVPPAGNIVTGSIWLVAA